VPERFTTQETNRCSAFSLAAGEQLYATAPRTDVWILVENPEIYPGKAVDESSLPDPVKAYLNATQKAIPNSRVLLIKKDNQPSEDRRSVFVGLSSGSSPRMYAFEITDYTDLFAIDIKRFITGTPDSKFDLVRKPVFLVCTNGRRDPCCSLWGVPVFRAAMENTGGNIWQCSHVGGHRFAANLICLPHGIYYGRVRPDSVVEIIEDYQSSFLNLEHYRGRSCYPPEAQAAEYFLMRETARVDINAYRFDSIYTLSGTGWDIRFVSNFDGSRYSVRLAIEPSSEPIFESCNTPDQRATRPQFRMEGWSKL
jgi:hypothetical protein